MRLEMHTGYTMDPQSHSGYWARERHAHTCVKKVYFGEYIGINEAGGWESSYRSKRGRGLKSGSEEEESLESYWGGRLDNSENDWIFLVRNGGDIECRRESNSPRAWVFGQTGISTSKGNTKVGIGFRNRIIGGRRIWWRILQVMIRKPREERSTRSRQCQILPKIPSQ